MLGEAGPLPCTPIGCIELLRRHGVELNGAEVVVVGRGLTVGRPMGLLLTRRSENSTVTLCHTGTRDLAAHTRSADVSSPPPAYPASSRGDMVKPGAAVLDVGVSRVDGKLAGDVAPEVWETAGWVSPNPGGVGPMTRAMLLSNIVSMAEPRPGTWPVLTVNEAEPDEGTPVEEPPLPEERRYPSTIGGAFYLLILAAMAVGIVAAYIDDWRLGVRIVGLALVAAAVLRLVLPQRDAGMLAVRHRLVDVAILAAMGAALIFLAGDIPGPPA